MKSTFRYSMFAIFRFGHHRPWKWTFKYHVFRFEVIFGLGLFRNGSGEKNQGWAKHSSE